MGPYMAPARNQGGATCGACVAQTHPKGALLSPSHFPPILCRLWYLSPLQFKGSEAPCPGSDFTAF